MVDEILINRSLNVLCVGELRRKLFLRFPLAKNKFLAVRSQPPYALFVESTLGVGGVLNFSGNQYVH